MAHIKLDRFFKVGPMGVGLVIIGSKEDGA